MLLTSLVCCSCFKTFRVNDPVALKLLGKAGEMNTLEAPEDESIKTLYVGGLDARVTEQDLRERVGIVMGMDEFGMRIGV